MQGQAGAGPLDVAATELTQRRESSAAAAGPDFSLNRLYYFSDAARPKLRIGVMINHSRPLQLFMRKVLEDVRNCSFANLECVIANCEPPPRRQNDEPLPLRAASAVLDEERRHRLLYLAYLRFLNRRWRGALDPCAPADCTDLFEGVRRIEVVPVRKRFVHRFPADAIEEIRALDLDVILRFGFNIVRGDVLAAARYGVWSFHHGDSERYRGGPALLWELMEHNPLSGAVLQRLDDSLDAGAILCRGVLATTLRPYVAANRYNVYWSTQHFVIRKLFELHRYGPEHLERLTRPCGAYEGKRAIYRTPTNVEMARWLVPTIVRSTAGKLRGRDRIWHWRIGIRRSTQPLYHSPESASAGFSWIDSPQGRFWADPFLMEDSGATWIFFEDYSYTERRGVIACGRVENGRVQDVRTVLERAHHLSFPQVFRHDGEIWMVPESEQVRQVHLYRAVKFPDEWVLDRTLLQLRVVDSVLFPHEGRWWMFASPLVVTGHAPFTLLFVAPQPWGPWSLHPAGCISGDVRGARCAGAVIRDGERLIRPSQECAGGYGHSVCFNEMHLGDATYEEKPCAQLMPEALRCIAGVHTYNRAGEWEVVDGRALASRRSLL